MNIFLQIILFIRLYDLYGNIFLEHFENIKNLNYSKMNGEWYEYIISKFENLNKYKNNIIKYNFLYYVNDNNVFDKIIYIKTDSDRIENGEIYYKNNKLLKKTNEGIESNYAILKIGDDLLNEYSYIITSEPDESKLSVLVRNITDFDKNNEKDKKDIEEYLIHYNFNYIVKNQTR